MAMQKTLNIFTFISDFFCFFSTWQNQNADWQEFSWLTLLIIYLKLIWFGFKSSQQDKIFHHFVIRSVYRYWNPFLNPPDQCKSAFCFPEFQLFMNFCYVLNLLLKILLKDSVQINCFTLCTNNFFIKIIRTVWCLRCYSIWSFVSF